MKTTKAEAFAKVRNAIKHLRSYMETSELVRGASRRDARIGQPDKWAGHVDAADVMMEEQRERVRSLFARRHKR
jgi:hypothetical protein